MYNFPENLGPCAGVRYKWEQKGRKMIKLTVLNEKQYRSLYPSEKYAYDHAVEFAVQDWNLPHRAEPYPRPKTLEDAYALARKIRAEGGRPLIYAVAPRHHEETFCFIPGPTNEKPSTT